MPELSEHLSFPWLDSVTRAQVDIVVDATDGEAGLDVLEAFEEAVRETAETMEADDE